VQDLSINESSYWHGRDRVDLAGKSDGPGVLAPWVPEGQFPAKVEAYMGLARGQCMPVVFCAVLSLSPSAICIGASVS
jgi:hypothetical protein